MQRFKLVGALTWVFWVFGSKCDWRRAHAKARSRQVPMLVRAISFAPCFASRLRVRIWDGCSGLNRGRGKFEGKAGTGRLCAAGDGSAMRLNESTAEGQSQAGSQTERFGGEKRLEKFGLNL